MSLRASSWRGIVVLWSFGLAFKPLWKELEGAIYPYSALNRCVHGLCERCAHEAEQRTQRAELHHLEGLIPRLNGRLSSTCRQRFRPISKLSSHHLQLAEHIPPIPLSEVDKRKAHLHFNLHNPLSKTQFFSRTPSSYTPPIGAILTSVLFISFSLAPRNRRWLSV